MVKGIRGVGARVGVWVMGWRVEEGWIGKPTVAGISSLVAFIGNPYTDHRRPNVNRLSRTDHWRVQWPPAFGIVSCRAADTLRPRCVMSAEVSPSPNTGDLVRNSSLYREFQAEREEILKHKWIESEKAGYDIGFERALTDWIVNHRAKWRRTRQQNAGR
jgi:hypothetical protein